MRYIIAIGIFQAMIVGAVLWKNRLRSSADSLLMLMVACIASHLAIKFVIYNFIGDTHVRAQMNTFIGYCYGPLLYLYALKVKNDEFIPASKWYVFLPFVIGAIAFFTIAGVLFISDFADYRLLKWYNNFSTVTMLGSELCFTYLSLRVISRETGTEKLVQQMMVKRLAFCFLSITMLSVLFFISSYFYPNMDMFVFRSIIYALLTAICILIGFYSVFQDHQNIQDGAGTVTVGEKIIGKKAPLSAERQKEIWETLEYHLLHYKLFTDSSLSLDKLASATGINKYHISETLNSYAQRTFYQYINEYRIKYAMDRMEHLHREEDPINVLTLAYDAGFKAKSSFNRYFKEITGFTPTEHLRSLN